MKCRDGYVLDAVCLRIYTCRRLIDLSLIAGTKASSGIGLKPTQRLPPQPDGVLSAMDVSQGYEAGWLSTARAHSATSSVFNGRILIGY